MFDLPILTGAAVPPMEDEAYCAVAPLLIALEDLAAAGRMNAASQYDNSALAQPSLATRYAAANPIARRRFDAILRESEAVARAGIGLIARRAGRHDPATIAAARFLGTEITGSLRKLESLLAPQSA